MTFYILCTPDVEAVKVPVRDGIPVLSCADPPTFFSGASIGRDLPHVLSRLSGQVSKGAQDLIAIAMAVTAADTFVVREIAADGWCRVLRLVVAVQDTKLCVQMREQLQDLLHFLSGDMWSLEFVQGPAWVLPSVKTAIPLSKPNCVSLFSGGLDSAIGTLDLIADGKHPLLVSHAYPKDAGKQNAIISFLPSGYHQLSFNADPRGSDLPHDVTMRTRSFNFLAVGAAAADAIAVAGNKRVVDLVVPENGFIALNAPLTARRLGSHSTRTTHPHFLSGYQSIIDGLGIRARIVNPYQPMTKGEMMARCEDQARLNSLASSTVSCGKWKRRNRQCGRCVPCIIRRAAFRSASLADETAYEYPDLRTAMAHPVLRDDLIAMCLSARRPRSGIEAWVAQSGPLPEAEAEYREWIGVAWRGMREVGAFLKSQGLPG